MTSLARQDAEPRPPRPAAGHGPATFALETSCDETAAAVISRDGRLLASEIATQVAAHEPFGGVVPEIASRNHLRLLPGVIDRTLERAGLRPEQIDLFAATAGPGLATSLMVGLAAAKGLALGARKPFLAVNHLEGHLLSPFFGTSAGVRPALGLVVSGGHTLLVDILAPGRYHPVGRTRDDAAGEAFDKVGKLLGLPYPGGPEIERLAREGNPARFVFPRSMLRSGDHDFSFSGIKTAVRYLLPKVNRSALPDLCASFQEAVVDVLVEKTLAAARAARRDTVALSGGVSCNAHLRERMERACHTAGLDLLVPRRHLCTDNAAMIAFAARLNHAAGKSSPLTTDLDPNLPLAHAPGAAC